MLPDDIIEYMRKTGCECCKVAHPEFLMVGMGGNVMCLNCLHAPKDFGSKQCIVHQIEKESA